MKFVERLIPTSLILLIQFDGVLANPVMYEEHSHLSLTFCHFLSSALLVLAGGFFAGILCMCIPCS